MSTTSKLGRNFGVATSLGLSILLLSSDAQAYNARTHQEMTNFAFNVMRLVAYQQSLPNGSNRPTLTPDGDTSLWVAPSGADAAKWKVFFDKISDSQWRILAAPAGLPNVGDCLVSNERMNQLPNFDLPDPNPGHYTGFHEQILHKSRAGDRTCKQAETRGLLVNALNTAFPHGQIVGSALGAHAADPDYYDLDWKFFFNPLAADASDSAGFTTFTNLTNKAFQAGTAIALAPIYCLVRIAQGKSCTGDDIKDFSDRANPLPQLRGLLAAPFGAFAFKTIYSTGLGHLLNLSPNQLSSYDDVSGFFQERSGYGDHPGQVDLEMMTAFDMLGTTVEPTQSRGAHDYEICRSGASCGQNEVRDDHQASFARSNLRWRSATVGHTQFTPLDNMAYFGWQKALNPNFPDGQPTAVVVAPGDLARPLHALGDAAAPHHMIAGLGWGHRPYENRISDSWDSTDHPVQALQTGTLAEQYKNARAILVEAFFWWNYIQQWRASFQPQYPLDIPVRNMITKMARRNYSYIISGNENTWDAAGIVPASALPPAAFPYFDTLDEWIGDDYNASWRNQYKAQIAHLINNSVAGSVAFLTAAGESMAPSTCGDGMVETKEQCDDARPTNGDGCSASCTVEAGWVCSADWPSICQSTAICGNGVIEPGEQCDGGPNCTNFCTFIPI